MRNCQYIRNLRGSGVKRGEYISRGINLSLNSHSRSLSLSLSVRNVHNCDAQRVGRRSVGRWRSFVRIRNGWIVERYCDESAKEEVEGRAECSLRSTSAVVPLFDGVQFAAKLMHRHAADISKREIYSGTCGSREKCKILCFNPTTRARRHALAYMNRTSNVKGREGNITSCGEEERIPSIPPYPRFPIYRKPAARSRYLRIIDIKRGGVCGVTRKLVVPRGSSPSLAIARIRKGSPI